MSKIYTASIFMEGDKASSVRVADLLLDYDRDSFDFVSAETGGFFIGSSNIRKDNWEETRSVQMSTSVDTSRPILKLKFKQKRNIVFPNINLSSNSTLYLSQIGSVTLPSEGLSYRIEYD